jgi:group I intron endonuclease
MEKICGIYKITSPNGKIYIGESSDIDTRKYYYKIVSCHKQIKLYNSLKKYGWNAHTFEILEECDFGELLCRERYWQDFYDVLGSKGLNLELTNCGDKKRVLSQLSKDKISKANSGVNNGMFGRSLSKEHLKILQEHKHTNEAILKIRERSFGENNPNAKLVLNTETGIFYGCVKDAAFTIGMLRDTLKQQLNGRRKNKTSFMYV